MVSEGPSVRIESLDALRGVTLFGILAINALTQFRVSLFESFDAHCAPTFANRAIERALAVGLDAKAFILFSLLFGSGLAAQSERAGRAHGPRILRRLVFLGMLGIVHLLLLWDGDVLALYALVALATLPLLRFGSRVLLAVAGALFVLQVLPLPYPHAFDSADAMATHIEAARRIYRHGSYGDVVAFRVRELRPALALLVWSAPRTLGLFLLGATAWRAGILQRSAPRSWALIASLGIGAGVVIALLSSIVAMLAPWADIAFAIGFGALVVLLARLPGSRAVLRPLVPIGQMTLTSYLVQSLILGFVFYGYGLGYFGRLDLTSALPVVLVLFVAQVLFAAWWLRRFRFGPLEWAWRAVTYGRRSLNA